MVIIETSIFTKRVKALLSDDDYRALQNELVARPDAVKIIPESGGLRKIRWSGSGRGKRGGTRLIYYWASSKNILLMLFLYAKNEQDDLSRAQLQALREIIETEFP